MNTNIRKIVGGKKYDTGTAKCIGYYTNSEVEIYDFAFETLYLKKTGEFFLHKWGEFQGYVILPMTVEEAKVWMEEHESVEAYEAAFGKVEE